MSNVKRLRHIALYSRLAFVGLSAALNLLIPDHVSDGFVAPTPTSDGENLLDKLVDLFLGGLCRWDAQHFLHVARYGYTYETNLAFFPLFPTALNYGSLAVTWITGMNFKSAFMVTGVIFNSALFIRSTIVLFKLSKIIFRNEQFAFNTALFFCFSPATIFFIAPYSEALFTNCTLNGMLSYANNEIKQSCIWFSISACTRSNGILNAGFLLHYYFYKIVFSFKTSKLSKNFIIDALGNVIKSIVCLIIISLPYISFQLDSFYRFCKGNFHFHPDIINYAEKEKLVLAGSNPIWCQEKYPIPYAYVQGQYWDVGFLKYFVLKQIPNFCLAFPIITIILSSCSKFLFKNKNLFINADKVYAKEMNVYKTTASQLPEQAFVYVVHAVALTIFCFFNINVQVTTRMLASSSPVLYWIASSKFLVKGTERAPDYEFVRSKLLKYKESFSDSCHILIKYFVAYAIVGTALFSNNYPWT